MEVKKVSIFEYAKKNIIIIFNMPVVLLLVATLLWSGNIVLGKAVSGSIPPITLSYVRWTIALILFTPICWHELKNYKQKIINNWITFSLLGVTGLMGFNMSVYAALQYTSAINVGLINSFSPAYVTLLSLLFLKEDIGIKQWLGIIISFIGTVWVISSGNWQVLYSFTFNIGDILVLFGIFLWGIYSLVLKTYGNIVPQKIILIASIGMGLVFTLPLIIFENYQLGLIWIQKLNVYHYLSFLYFGIFPTIVAFLFFNRGIIKIGPSKASVFMNFIPIYTTILGILFLQEILAYSHIIIGGVLIIFGVYLTSMSEREISESKKLNF